MLKRMYDWTLALAAHHRADHALAFVSFIESSVFPIPPDVLLMPMVLARRERAWYLATVCTVASVFGALLGYGLGYFAFETVGRPIIEAYGYMPQFERFETAFTEWGGWLVFIFGVSIFPFKVITIASGVAKLSLPVFLFSSIVARGLRFFIVAALLWKFGPPIREFAERRLSLLATLFTLLLVGGFFALKFI
jgi:membrane protein YqaA with SNARE-associated domain